MGTIKSRWREREGNREREREKRVCQTESKSDASSPLKRFLHRPDLKSVPADFGSLPPVTCSRCARPAGGTGRRITKGGTATLMPYSHLVVGSTCIFVSLLAPLLRSAFKESSRLFLCSSLSASLMRAKGRG